MNPPARRFPRVAPAIVAAALIAGAVFATPGTAEASSLVTTSPSTSAATVPTTGEPAGIAVALSVPDNGVVAYASDLQVSVEIADPGPDALTDATLTIALDPTPLTTPADYTGFLGDTTATGSASVLAIDGLDTVITTQTPTVNPGGSHTVQLSVPAAELPFDEWGVYGVQATVSSGGSALAASRTTIVWGDANAAPSTPVGVTVVAPITSAASSNGLIKAATLEAITGDAGTLTQQLDAVIGRPVTIAIDPRIIVSIRALGSTAPPSAVAWLARLAGAPNEIIPLTFADSDIAGEHQAGATEILEPTSFSYALDPADFTDVDELIEPTADPAAAPTGSSGSTGSTDPAPNTPSPTPTPSAAVPTLDQLLDWDYSSESVAWPRAGTVMGDDLGFFAASGYTSSILDSRQVQTTGGLPLSSTVTVAGTGADGSPTEQNVLVADHGVSQAIQDALGASTETRRGEASAQLSGALAIAAEEAGRSSATGAGQVLAVLDRNAMNLTSIDGVLDTIESLPWASPAPLTELLAITPSQSATVVDGTQPEGRIDGIRTLLDDGRRIDAFSSVLSDPSVLTGKYRSDLLALLSNSWVANAGGWSVAVGDSHEATEKTLSSVQVVDGSSINMVANQANLPVTVSNELPYPVTVVLHVTPSNGRLVVEQSDVEVTIEASSRKGAQIPLQAGVANGPVTLSFQVLSPSGVLVSVPAPVLVNVSADWETWGTVIFAVLLVLVFGVGVVRSVLRRRKARGDTTELDGPGGPDPTGGTSS